MIPRLRARLVARARKRAEDAYLMEVSDSIVAESPIFEAVTLDHGFRPRSPRPRGGLYARRLLPPVTSPLPALVAGVDVVVQPSSSQAGLASFRHELEPVAHPVLVANRLEELERRGGAA